MAELANYAQFYLTHIKNVMKCHAGYVISRCWIIIEVRITKVLL